MIGAGRGWWQAIIPQTNGEQVITRYTPPCNPEQSAGQRPAPSAVSWACPWPQPWSSRWPSAGPASHPRRSRARLPHASARNRSC